MEIKNSLLSFLGYLQTPFDIYHADVCSNIRYDHEYVDTIQKVITVTLGIVLYPALGALYLVGRVLDWMIYQTVKPTAMHETASLEEVNHHQSLFKDLQKKTNALLHQKVPPKVNALSVPTKPVLEVISQAYNSHFLPKEQLPEGVTAITAGFHTCFFYDQTPDVVYKLNQNDGYTKEQAEAYVDQANRARALCQQDNLFFLQVPQSMAVKLPDGNYAILQEKVAVDGHFYQQRGIYRSFLSCPDSKAYIKELHRQLAIFIAKFKFSDVKYNNIPITKDGYVALLDLDEQGAATGFLSGASKKVDGLLADLPTEWQHEILDTARPYLPLKECQAIEKAMPKRKALSEKRWRKVHDYLLYAQKHAIQTPAQKVQVEAIHLKGLTSRERTLALSIIEKINHEHELRKNWLGLRSARVVWLGTNTHDPLTKEMSYLFADLTDGIKNVCEHLKAIGAIYAYKQNTKYYQLKVYS